MSYLADPPGDDPEVRRLYDADLARLGYVANYTRALALRPAAIDGWLALNGAVRGAMDLRRYELATLAAARALGSRYCTLAHTKVLRDRFAGETDVSATDAAVMAFAAKVAREPDAVTPADVGALRGHGLTDTEILDVALTAAVRCFFSTVIAAVGAEPDPALLP